MGSLCQGLFGSSASTTYQPPEAVKNAVTDILGRAATQSNQPYPQYTPDTAAKYSNYNAGLLAPMTPNQAQAGQSIAGLQGYTAPNFYAATNLVANAANPLQMQQFSQNAVNQYMNPYLNDVVGSAVANINQTNAQQQQQVLGNAIQRGAFGGDRAGIAQAELARQQGLANNATIANLLGQGYSQAQQQFNQQQQTDLATQLQNRNLMTNAGLNLANLGTQGQQAALQQAQAQYGYGTAQQQQQQAGLSTAYQQYLNQQAFPYQQLSYYAGLASGAAPAMGGTTTGYSPTVSNAGGVLGGLSILGGLSNPGAVSASNPYSAASAGLGAFTSGFGSLFGLKDGGRANYENGGRVGFAEGGVPVSPVTQAYNDYINAISAGAPYDVLQQLYQKYQQSFQGAVNPWEKTATTAVDATKTPAAVAATNAVPDTSNIGRAGDKFGNDNSITARNADYSPDYTSSNGPVGGNGYGPYDNRGGPGTAFNPGGLLGGLTSGLAAALQGTTNYNKTPYDPTYKGVVSSMGEQPSANEPSGVSGIGIQNPERPIDERAGFYGTPSDGGADLPTTKSSSNPFLGMSKDEFISAITPMAQKTAQETGVDPRLIISQAALETGYGQHMVGGNLFGIKGVGTGAVETPENLPGQGNVLTKASFAAYPNPQASFDAYGKLIASNPRYAGVLSAPSMIGQTLAMGKSGYATDPAYASKLMQIERGLAGPALPNQGPGAMDPMQRQQAARSEVSPGLSGFGGGSETPKGIVSETPSEGFGAASEGHGGNNQTRDTSGDRTVYSSPIGPGLTDRIDSGNHEAGTKEESQSEHNEKRGGRIHPHHYADGGFTPFHMQYGLPSESDIEQQAQDYAGSGAGVLGPQLEALAAKGVLPSAKGGRIHAQTGVGISADEKPTVHSWDEADDNAQVSKNKSTTAAPVVESRFKTPLQQLGTAISGAVKSADETISPIAGAAVKAVTEPQYVPDPNYVAPKYRSMENAGPYDAAAAQASEKRQAAGTYTKPYEKTQPIDPTKSFAVDQTEGNVADEGEAPAQAAPARPAAPQKNVAPGIKEWYNAPPPIDMRQMAAFNFGANLLAGGDFGSNLARAGHDYANTMLAQQNQQRATMQNEAESALQRSQGIEAGARTAKERIQPMGLGYSIVSGTGTPEDPIMLTGIQGTDGQAGGTTMQGGAGGAGGKTAQIVMKQPYGGETYIPDFSDNPQAQQTAAANLTMLAHQAKAAMPMQPELAKKNYELSQAEVQAARQDAKLAADNIVPYTEVMDAIHAMPQGGPLSPGLTGKARYTAIAGLNEAARTVGIDLGLTDTMSAAEIMQKFATAAANQTSESRAAKWLETTAASLPSIGLNLPTMQKLAANQFTSAHTKQLYANTVAKLASESDGQDRDMTGHFYAVNPRQNQVKLQNAIYKLMNAHQKEGGKADGAWIKNPETGRYETPISMFQHGQLTAEQFDKISYNLTGMKNMSSVFGAGQ